MKKIGKLRLAKETVRDLGGKELNAVAAGSGPTSCQCSVTCDSVCALCAW